MNLSPAPHSVNLIVDDATCSWRAVRRLDGSGLWNDSRFIWGTAKLDGRLKAISVDATEPVLLTAVMLFRMSDRLEEEQRADPNASGMLSVSYLNHKASMDNRNVEESSATWSLTIADTVFDSAWRILDFGSHPKVLNIQVVLHCQELLQIDAKFIRADSLSEVDVIEVSLSGRAYAANEKVPGESS